MTDVAREPPRQVWHFFLLLGVIVVLLVSHVASNRPFMIGSFNNVAPAGDLPATVTDVPDDWSLTIARRDWKTPVARTLGRAGEARAPRMGWVVREWSFMTLPLIGWRQSDLAAFREDDYGYRLLGLTPAQLRQVEQAGAPWFPWWRHVWGWLVVAAGAAFAWGELRWQARRRSALGLI